MPVSKHFEHKNFSEDQLPGKEFEDCHFVECNFYGLDITEVSFIECTFKTCQFGMNKTNLSAWKDVKFYNCKLLGMQFDHVKIFLLQMSFDDCVLDLSNFIGLPLEKTTFINCSLVETDFSKSNLNGSIFNNCNLDRAVFDQTSLEESDFRTAFNFRIDPINNNIYKAKFSKENLEGLLYGFNLQID